MAQYQRGGTLVEAEQWFPEMGAMQGRHGVWLRGRPMESPLASMMRSLGIALLAPTGFDAPTAGRRRRLRAGDWIVTGPRGGQKVVPAERFAREYRPVPADGVD